MTSASQTTVAPIAHGPGEGEHFWFFGGLTTIKADGAETGGRVMVTEQLAPRGSGSPLHVHHNEDEWFYVLEGELTIWVDGQVVDAPAGSWVISYWADKSSATTGFSLPGSVTGRHALCGTGTGHELLVGE